MPESSTFHSQADSIQLVGKSVSQDFRLTRRFALKKSLALLTTIFLRHEDVYTEPLNINLQWHDI